MAGEEVSSLSLPHNVEACRQQAGSVLKSGRLPGARLLLQHGVSPAFVFFSAAQLNMIDIMNELWEKHKSKIDLDTAVLRAEGDNCRETPLTVAAKYGAFCAVEWLLNHGANVDSLSSYGPNNGPVTALWTAAEKGFVRICQKLLDHGADVNTYKRSSNNTALFVAVQNGHGIVASQLIRAGANVNDPRGTAPLLIAICRGKPDMVALLLNAGANLPTDALMALQSINGQRKSALSANQFKLTDYDIMMVTAVLKGGLLKPGFPATFETSRSLERKGKFREALRENANAQIELERTDGPPGLLQISPAWAQLLLDGRRLMDAVYGPKGSDGRISQWDRHKFYATDKHPPAVQFYAWVNHKNKIYRHGGLDFINVQQVPSLDALWAFNKDTRQWQEIKTSGPSPGPRAHHCAAVVEDSMYVYGGKTNILRRYDSEVYALSLTTMTWKAQKAKGGAKPPDRKDASMIAYKGKLYLFGGSGQGSNHELADLWVYNVTTQKWKELKPGSRARHNHNTWAARDKLYVFGGLALSPDATNCADGLHTIQDLQVYDIPDDEWSCVRCVGEDPWNLAEYTALPLYRGDEEPFAVIVFGGYQHIHESTVPDMHEAKARYGTELNQFKLPYFKRLLSLDLDTMIWTKLEPLRETDSIPTAQAWAYETMDGSGIVLGGGYGLNAHSRALDGRERLSSLSLGLGDDALEMAIMNRIRQESVFLEEKGYHSTSHISVFEVRFEDERKCCAAKDAAAGKGWAWELADAPGTLRPSMEIDSRLGSPLLYRHLGLCDGDFGHPPKDANGKVLTIQDDDEQILGRRVVLQGLKGRPELNGSTARCGPWIAEKGRYQVFLSSYERYAPATLAIKPANLGYAPKLWDSDLKGFFGVDMNKINESPDLIGIWYDVGGKDSHNPFVQQPGDADEKNMNMCNDTYRGPLSAEANAVVLALNCETKTGNGTLILSRLPTRKLEEKAAEGDQVAKEKLAKVALYSEFLDRIRHDDTARINAWQENTVAGREESKWGDCVELTVSFDAVVPVIERTLLVSPNISMQRLHLQILCPAIGWAPIYTHMRFVG
jgi:N-acetylneuraminic acid mutarotase